MMVIYVVNFQTTMPSIIFFEIRSLPPMLSGIPFPSTASALWGTKSQFSLSHSSLSPNVGHKRLLMGHVFQTKIRAFNGSSVPSDKDDNDKKIGRCMVGASFVLAFALGVISGGWRMNPRAIAGPKTLTGKGTGKMQPALGEREAKAMRSLLDVTIALSSSKIQPPSARFVLPPRPSMKEVNDIIKKHAVQKIRYGKAEDGVNFLEDAYNHYIKDPEIAYYVEMALVELLIFQGKYEEALKRKCLNESQPRPSDVRFPLYKAIIHTMRDEKEEAQRWWKEYRESVEGGFDPNDLP